MKKLTNTQVIELAKFFLLDQASSKIEMSFASHVFMKENLKIFKEVFNEFATLERSVMELSQSEEMIKYYEELKELIIDHLEKDEDGKLIPNPDGSNRIIAGHEKDVQEINAEFSKSEKWVEFFDSKRKAEEDFRDDLAAECSQEINFIPLASLDLNNVKLNSNQWSILELIIEG